MHDQAPPVAPGELLAGKYRVDHALGEGGMGVVVAATNVALSQRVAIKLLRASALQNVEALGRFLREARAAASLRSEHVARVLDVGHLDDGRPYMVMEYLDGRDLGDVVEKEPPLPVAVAVDYVLQACEAIAEAHASGIIHRDLKPRNLFLTHTVDGRPLVKVLDFGISKIEGLPADMQLTRTTEIIGSPSYMSPEQLRASKSVDARTDIWALGVILYELLTQRLPFYATTVTALVAIVVTERETPVRSLRPDVPEGLAEVLTRCLGKRPDERYPSVAELVHALEPFGTGATATFSDRIRRVAQSGKLPPTTGSNPSLAAAAESSPGLMQTALHAGPPPARPAARVESATPAPGVAAYVPPAAPSAPKPGNTGLVWGATGGGPKAARASKTGLVVGLALLGFLGIAAGGGALVLVKRTSADTVAGGMPLPSGRKDLPPLEPSAAPPAPPPPSAAQAPSAMPDTRGSAADSASAAPTASVAPSAKAKAPRAPKPPPPKPADDLKDIGRR